jgi:hypothetical protein
LELKNKKQNANRCIGKVSTHSLMLEEHILSNEGRQITNRKNIKVIRECFKILFGKSSNQERNKGNLQDSLRRLDSFLIILG